MVSRMMPALTRKLFKTGDTRYFEKLYDLWCRMHGLRRSDREVCKYHRYKRKMNRQKYIIQRLTDGYKEAFAAMPVTEED